MKEWLIDILKALGLMSGVSVIISAILIMAKYAPYLLLAFLFVCGCAYTAYMMHEDRKWQDYNREVNKRFREYLHKNGTN